MESRETSFGSLSPFPISTLANVESISYQITLLGQEIDKLPYKVRFDEAHGREKLVDLNYDKKAIFRLRHFCEDLNQIKPFYSV